MRSRSPIISWLVFAGLADWLVARTLTRLGIFIPKSPLLIGVYQGITGLGQWISTLAALLALGFLVWIAWRSRRRTWLSGALVGLALLSLAALVAPPAGGVILGAHLFGLAALGMMLVGASPAPGGVKARIALWLPALALAFGRLYQALPALYAAMHWPGPPRLSAVFFNLGESLVVLSAFAWWWAHGRRANPRVWFWASLPALLFSGFFLANPAMAGVLTIWSTGLTLFLPWPVYALGLWLTGVTVLVSWRRGNPAGPAILLLAAGGFAPQLSTQAFLGLIAIWLAGGRLPGNVRAPGFTGATPREEMRLPEGAALTTLPAE